MKLAEYGCFLLLLNAVARHLHVLNVPTRSRGQSISDLRLVGIGFERMLRMLKKGRNLLI